MRWDRTRRDRTGRDRTRRIGASAAERLGGAGDQVVLLDEAGNAVGAAPKREVHDEHTPLHLAFSCYLFDGHGNVLVTQRALQKRTWPGVWTNSACGHPAPGEELAEAVVRRVGQELGVEVRELRLALPAFRYEAVMADGVRENEMCPVFTAVATGAVTPEPEEVAEVVWEPWEDFCEEVLAFSREVSPWCREQVAQLAELGVGITGARVQDRSETWAQLPAAARRGELPR